MASSLGLSLTNPQSLSQQTPRALTGGLTVSVEGFSALPAVQNELDMIAEMFTTTELRDQDFLGPTVSREMSEGNYSIVHMATHGQFKPDYRDSFILTYDGRMTMDMLEETVGARKYLNEPVELLMLSACETAVGDNRAALGLAGIALKAGARSAVATLWAINDEASSRLVGDFYRQLKDRSQSKAQALRQAQLILMSDNEYTHPVFWSPYLLLGNWL